MIRLAVMLALLLPLPAGAGPWPRAAGQVFLSLSAERDRAGGDYAAAYAEYGLTARTTLGLELGRSAAETSAILWLQHPLDDGQGAHRLVVQSGLGAVRRGEDLLPLAQAALSWGRGFERWGGGWMTAQVLARMTGGAPEAMGLQTRGPGRPSILNSFQTAEWQVKADLTLGLRPREGLMVINGLWLEEREDTGFSARLAPSLVWDAPGPVQIELGLVQPMAGGAEQALRLATWLEF